MCKGPIILSDHGMSLGEEKGLEAVRAVEGLGQGHQEK